MKKKKEIKVGNKVRKVHFVKVSERNRNLSLLTPPSSASTGRDSECGIEMYFDIPAQPRGNRLQRMYLKLKTIHAIIAIGSVK